jgi:hypothetical protein
MKLRLRLEERALLGAVQAASVAERGAAVRQFIIRPEFDWQLFCDLATQQQVLPLCADLLGQPALSDHVPHGVRRQARLCQLQTLFYNTTAHRELARIGQTMHAAGVPAVPLKGTQLAERLFGSLEARQTGDIDVLVRESDLVRARALLEGELGYVLSTDERPGLVEHAFHGRPYVRRGPAQWHVVELHWGLSHPALVTVEPGRLWERILAATPADQPLAALPAEETLVFLTMHFPKHDLGALRLLADIDRLLRREVDGLNWELALDLAERWGALWLLHVGLLRAVELFRSPVPPAVLARSRPPVWRRRVVAALAGSERLLRPATQPGLRYTQTQLAYCVMLGSGRRFLRGYYLNLVLPHSAGREGGSLATRLRSVALGLGWTGLVLGGNFRGLLTSLVSVRAYGRLPERSVP